MRIDMGGEGGKKIEIVELVNYQHTLFLSIFFVWMEKNVFQLIRIRELRQQLLKRFKKA